MTKSFFVAGTDTDVGKTFASCAMLEAAALQGRSTMGLKPVSAGCEYVQGEWKNNDALLLQQHMTSELSYSQINPVALKAAASPHIAAHLEQRGVSASRMVGVCRGALLNRPDFALIEGAGGWRVPISKRETMADLAKQLGYPVILVVALRLGCLNHAMLTAEAIKRDGLSLAGWIANQPLPDSMPYQQDNITTLCSALGAPLLGVLPFSDTSDPKQLCKYLALDCLDL